MKFDDKEETSTLGVSSAFKATILRENVSDFEIIRKVRAYDKWPGTFTFWNNKRIKIIDVAETQIDSLEKPGLVKFIDKKIFVSTQNKFLEIKKIQFEGKKIMSVDKVINGYSNLNGSCLD